MEELNRTIEIRDLITKIENAIENDKLVCKNNLTLYINNIKMGLFEDNKFYIEITEEFVEKEIVWLNKEINDSKSQIERNNGVDILAGVIKIDEEFIFLAKNSLKVCRNMQTLLNVINR